MDLNNNQITLGEIINNPKAREILVRAFPEFATPFYLRMARNMSLEKILRLAREHVSQDKINSTIEELRRL